MSSPGATTGTLPMGAGGSSSTTSSCSSTGRGAGFLEAVVFLGFGAGFFFGVFLRRELSFDASSIRSVSYTHLTLPTILLV